MKCLIKVFFIALSIVTLQTNAELLTVNFKANITSSGHPTILIGQPVDITLTYETTTPNDGTNLYSDISPGSHITTSFESGLTFSTDTSLPNKINIYSYSQELAPNDFLYDTNFHSPNATSSDPTMINNHIELRFSTHESTNPNQALRVNWGDVSSFDIKELSLIIDGYVIQAPISHISTAPVSAVTVDAMTYSGPIPERGGRLYFFRNVTNTISSSAPVLGIYFPINIT
jgi:hypothetical protein